MWGYTNISFEWGYILLIVISFIICSGIGSIISKSDSIIENAFLGLGICGIIIGIFANRSVYIIKYLIPLLYLLGLIFVIYNFKKKNNTKEYLYMSIAGALSLVSFYFLHPTEHIFKINDVGEVFHLFDGNNTYLSGQATEMLIGEYSTRLKINNVYPYQWDNYHFFNSAANAFLQYLMPIHNLTSYLNVRVIFSLLIVWSIVIELFKYHKNLINALLSSAVFLLLIFTLFAEGVMWNLRTNGTYSIIAGFYFIYYLFKTTNFDIKNKRNIIGLINWSFLLGASVMRLVPSSIAYASSIALILYYVNKNQFLTIKAVSSRIKQLITEYWNVIFLAGIYLCYLWVTINPKLSIRELKTREYYDEGWFYLLGLLEYFKAALFPLKDILPISITKDMNEEPWSKVILIYAIVGTLIYLLVKKINWTKAYKSQACLYFCLAVISYCTSGHKFFYTFLLWSMYLLVMTHFTWRYNFFQKKILLSGMLAALYLLYLGVNEITGPMPYIIFDTFLIFIILFSIENFYPFKKKIGEDLIRLLSIVAILYIAIFYKFKTELFWNRGGWTKIPNEIVHSKTPNKFVGSILELKNYPYDPGPEYNTDRKDIYYDMINGFLGSRLMIQPGWRLLPYTHVNDYYIPSKEELRKL